MREKSTKMGTSSPIRLRIVHQNRIFRECLAEVLSKDVRFQAVPVDHTAIDCRTAIIAERPQVILIDWNLPDQLALDLTRHFHDQASEPHVILMTHGTSHDDLVECFTAGAHGCVPEDSSLEGLCEAIEKVAAGEILYSQDVIHSMFHRRAQKSREGRHDRNDAPTLTSRELEIVRLVAEHLSNKQIARRLSVSLYTVKNHIHNIVEKLNVSGRYEAVDVARKHRLLGPARVPAPAHGEH